MPINRRVDDDVRAFHGNGSMIFMRWAVLAVPQYTLHSAQGLVVSHGATRPLMPLELADSRLPSDPMVVLAGVIGHPACQ